MILVFDSETTALPSFSLPAEDPSQPHIVQLGAILYDKARHVVSEINVLIRPDGWTISPETTAIHGITQEQAQKYGLKLETAIGLFIALADRAELLVAHNYKFDEKMVRRELHHLNKPSMAEAMRGRANYCTMESSTNILQIPGPRGFKWPKLQEAHVHFLGKPFEGSHDAMEDVRACARVYFCMNPLPSAPTPAPVREED